MIWSSNVANFSYPIFDSLVGELEQQWFFHRLTKENMKNGCIKDLSRIPRDLRKVIVIDDDPDAVQLHPDNAIIIKKFE